MQLQPAMSEELSYSPDQLAICGANERYSPPIVLFEDALSATLLFRVDETTSRSQFLAHYAFPSVNHPDTGIAIKGGTRIGGDSTTGRGKLGKALFPYLFYCYYYFVWSKNIILQLIKPGGQYIL